MIDIKLWIEALTKPVETFRKYRETNIANGFWNVVIASVVAGLIMGIVAYMAVMLVVGSLFGGFDFLGLGTQYAISAFFSSFIMTPVTAVIAWAVFSFIINWLATYKKKKSDFNTVANLMAIIIAPVTLLSAVVSLVPYAGFWLSILVMLYSVYLTALALNEYYGLGYSLGMGSGKKKAKA